MKTLSKPIDRPRLAAAAALAASWRDAKLREHREKFDAARVAADAFLSALGRAQLFFSFGTNIIFTIEAGGKSHRADFGAGHRIALEKQSFEKALSNLVHDDMAMTWISAHLRERSSRKQAAASKFRFDEAQPYRPLAVVDNRRRRATPAEALAAHDVVASAVVNLLQGMDMYVSEADRLKKQAGAAAAGNRLDGGRLPVFGPYVEEMKKRGISPREFAIACVLGRVRDLSDDQLTEAVSAKKRDIDRVHRQILDAASYRRRRIRKT